MKHGLGEPSFHDRLWAWIFTAGVREYIEPMIFEPPEEITWCRINPTTWNKGMKEFVYALPHRAHTGSEKGHYFK